MSKVFNNTTDKNGLIQSIEDKLGFDDGVITGDATLLAKFTAKVNEGMVSAWKIAFTADGTWQFDDTNHGDNPIITTNLVANQRNYTFLTDENGNLILSVDRVFARVSSTGVFQEIYPVDVQSEQGTEGYTDGQNNTGVPFTYDKTANGFFLDPIPSYDSDDGLRVYISREGSLFTTSDNTKKPGIAGLFHDYPALFASYEYARDKGHENVARLERDLFKMEKEMKDYYSKREKDVRKVLSGMPIDFI